MNKGDIILIPFPFTDLTGSKYRPAIVLIEVDSDITVSFITTQLQWKEETDILLKPNLQNGLKKDSLIRLSKIATLDKSLALGRLGSIDSSTMHLMNDNLKSLFKLS